jgi:hypothetical protein
VDQLPHGELRLSARARATDRHHWLDQPAWPRD